MLALPSLDIRLSISTSKTVKVLQQLQRHSVGPLQRDAGIRRISSGSFRTIIGDGTVKYNTIFEYRNHRVQKKLPRFIGEALPFYSLFDHIHKPKIAYKDDMGDANLCIAQLKGTHLGFNVRWPPSDAEWECLIKEGLVKRSDKRKTILQFCDESLIVLIEVEDEIPSKAVEILCDPKIYKVGTPLRRDFDMLLQRFSHQFFHRDHEPKDETDPDHDSKITKSPLAGHLDLGLISWLMDHQAFRVNLNFNSNSSVSSRFDDLNVYQKALCSVNPLREMCKVHLGKQLRWNRWDDWKGDYDSDQRIQGTGGLVMEIDVDLDVDSLMVDGSIPVECAEEVYMNLQLLKKIEDYAVMQKDFLYYFEPICDMFPHQLKATTVPLHLTQSTSGGFAGLANGIKALRQSLLLDGDVEEIPGPLAERIYTEFAEGRDIVTIAQDKGISTNLVE
ncbi:uncharacterized protein I303_103421 [Kwoniella dejecticola CBS 10117]|uniref:Uncharacterized protein n=1 Tax=Kwoniella dejecticola CBS 10117 TaxID=1296121 RepID=A0A1A6A6P4_9TREE|nr:uncharacterized protein I303_03443 [Kwoniella dejecticola CBS 10117]OBR85732.1 hypothetical protein I303_03443 [Kwoniella dejecticola CBS 10117]